MYSVVFFHKETSLFKGYPLLGGFLILVGAAVAVGAQIVYADIQGGQLIIQGTSGPTAQGLTAIRGIATTYGFSGELYGTASANQNGGTSVSQFDGEHGFTAYGESAEGGTIVERGEITRLPGNGYSILRHGDTDASGNELSGWNISIVATGGVDASSFGNGLQPQFGAPLAGVTSLNSNLIAAALLDTDWELRSKTMRGGPVHRAA